MQGDLMESPSLRSTRKKHVLSEDVEKRNEEIHSIRARVETPFATSKRIFRNLAEKFRDDAEQHDCLVRTALAFHNLRLRC